MASVTGLGPEPDSADSIRSRGTHACTTAEMAKPSTSAHHTSHAMRKLSFSPFHRTSSTLTTLSHTPRGYLIDSAAMATERGYTASKDDLLRRLARVEGQVRGLTRMVEEEMSRVTGGLGLPPGLL